MRQMTNLIQTCVMTAVMAGSLFAEDTSGLQISAAGDIQGNLNSDGTGDFLPREGEVLLYAPVDQIFDGRLNIAAHNESNEYHFEIHELSFGSTKLIPRSRFRLGHYSLGIGRLNQFHRHDWPFATAPKYHAAFFGEEGVKDSGLEYSLLLPTPFFLDLTVGVGRGYAFDTEGPGAKPVRPTHYARLVTYNGLFAGGGMQTGLNYIGRTDNAGTDFSYLGLDLTGKWRTANVLKFLFQTEIWQRKSTAADLTQSSASGFYIYPQYALVDSVSLGVRFDGYSTDVGFDYAVVPTLTYKASEFSTLRVSYNEALNHLDASTTEHSRAVQLQAVFILGSHPVHDF